MPYFYMLILGLNTLSAYDIRSDIRITRKKKKSYSRAPWPWMKHTEGFCCYAKTIRVPCTAVLKVIKINEFQNWCSSLRKSIEIIQNMHLVVKRQWLQICLWILKFENLFICHLWRNSNARGECSRHGRNELMWKINPQPNLNHSPNLTLTLKRNA